MRRILSAASLALALAALAIPSIVAAQTFAPGELLIKFSPGATASDRAAVAAAISAHVVRIYSINGYYHMGLDAGTVESALATLAGDARVSVAEPNYLIHSDLVPDDPLFGQIYALQNTGLNDGVPGADIHAVNAWDITTGNPDLTIALIDGGADYNHADLTNNIWTNGDEASGITGQDDDFNGYIDDLHGYDFQHRDADPMDEGAHGTLMCGAMAASGNNGIGVTGVLWHTRVLLLKVMDGVGEGTIADAIEALQYAVSFGVPITCNAWGLDTYSQSLLDAINAAGVAGQLFVTSAGNSGRNIDVQPYYPASYASPYILTVGASDNRDSLAAFSNYGNTSVDVVAPGSLVLTTEPGSRYLIRSGTSLSAAYVAGVCGLVESALPGFTALQTRDQIIRASDHIPALVGRIASAGRVNAARAVAGPDIVAPGAITDLAVPGIEASSVLLRWTATGNDGGGGTASRYDIRYSPDPIDDTNFASATPVTGPTPSPAGAADSAEVTGLTPNTLYYFALTAIDGYGNVGPISNVASATTLAPPVIAIAPASVSGSVLTGGTRIETVRLFNNGPGALDFTVSAPQFHAMSPDDPAGTAPEASPAPGGPTTSGSGGPDGFGYIWTDSDDPNGPHFGWVDITGVGTLLPIMGDETVSAPVAMGMTFPFYGGAFSNVRVATNGYLSFTSSDSEYTNVPLPSTFGVPNMIAALWDDLDFRGTQRAYTYGDGARFVVSWIGVPGYYTGGPYTFQVILFPSGEIRLQYRSLGSPANGATVGIQNATETVGLTVVSNSAYLHDSLAIRIRTIPAWLSVLPQSGRVPGNGHLDLAVRLDGAGLMTGFYGSDFDIVSNDPLRDHVTVPARLHVVGAPDIALNHTSLAFDSVSVGATEHRTLTILNQGVRDLVISSITKDQPWVTTSLTHLSVAPGLASDLDVAVAPPGVGPLSASLTLWTNDLDEAMVTVPISALGYPGARLTVTPDSLAVVLNTNAVTTRTLHLENHGGVNLNVTATPILPTAAPVLARATPRAGVSAPETKSPPQAKGEADRSHGPAPLRAGGPDQYGYTYSDSDEPGGPIFVWQDIRPIGTALSPNSDDQTSPAYPIGFSFPFYGAFYDSFRVCTNGFISFTSSSSPFINTTLPNAAEDSPENLLAIFWDDLTFGGVQRAWYESDSTRLVVQFQDVQRFAEPATNTFEAILYPDGRIVYQYLTLNTTLRNSCTVGIQNATRTDGLQVAFNANYVKNSLALGFRPPNRFLAVSPTGISIPPGGSGSLSVQFSAFGLGGGTYLGSMRLSSNDEVQPVVDIPCRLTVAGAPDIAVSPTTLDFGEVFVGYSDTLSLRVANLGSSALDVTGFESSDPAYTGDASSFSLPPHGEQMVRVVFAPTAARAYPATVTLVSTDPDTPRLDVPVAGNALTAPVAHVTPAAISTALASNLTPEARLRTRSVVIQNTGGSVLRWKAGATSGAGATLATSAARAPMSEPMNTQPPKDAPDAPALPASDASGGPDTFGYVWEDSDQPGGPAFSWVDISGIGTSAGFSRDDQNSGPIALPFQFPFYGQVFGSVRVCTNGWLSFTSGDSTYFNVALPNAGTRTPSNLVAPFWEDQDLRSSGAVYDYYDGSRFIVSYVGVPHWAEPNTVPPGRYTYQVLLYPSGEIDFQYLDMQGVVNSSTIGIQNATRDVALQVGFNTAYVHNNLRVRIQRRSHWLSVVPDSGVVAVGQHDTLRVNFDATGLADNDYSGSVDLTTNDPLLPSATVNVALHVGVATGTLSIDAEHAVAQAPSDWVMAHLTAPGTGCAPQDIAIASVRVAGTVPVASGAPVGFDGCAAVLGFERLAVLPLLPSGAVSPVEVIGEVSDVTWFSARDTISMLRPDLSRPAAPYLSGQQVTLSWTDAGGSPPSHYDLWYSDDEGDTWSQVAAGLTGHAYDWSAPITTTTQGWLELVAHATSDGALVGSVFSGPFTVVFPGIEQLRSALPERFDLRFAGSNPAREAVRLELSVPRRDGVRLEIFDVRGALVRRLATGVFEPGRHLMMWDGRDEHGHGVAAGVYFARATTRGAVVRVRLALIR